MTKISAIVLVSTLLVQSFYPSKESIAYIIGGATVWNVAKMEEVQELPENLVNAANTFLKGVAKEEEED